MEEQIIPGQRQCDNLFFVRHLRYLPLAFLVGQEGFVFFLPFLIACLLIHLGVRAALNRAVPGPVPRS